MLIVADENIPFHKEAFASLGEVRPYSGRHIDPACVVDADVLLVRSVTPVDRNLLEGSRVKFVGSATAGLDHVDADWLRKSDIAFSHAGGSNAKSVAQYITAALFAIRKTQEIDLKGRMIGIVGVGHCGSRVRRVAEALGMNVMLCDPPKQKATGGDGHVPLSALSDCDFITLHVPLTIHGQYPTTNLIDEKFLATIKSGAVIVNASRGGVVDESALLKSLASGRVAHAVIDTWIGEPQINSELLDKAVIATPHIAGYATDAKVRGTEVIYRALCQFLDIEPSWEMKNVLGPMTQKFELRCRQEQNLESVITPIIESVYPLARDNRDMKDSLNESAEARVETFDRLRKCYPTRREFCAAHILIDEGWPEMRKLAMDLGFSIEGSE